jgi:hypothetical protein
VSLESFRCSVDAARPLTLALSRDGGEGGNCGATSTWSVGAAADLAVAGMDAGRKALLPGDAGEQGGEGFLFFLRQGTAKFFLMFARDAADGLKCIFSFRGKMQGVGAAVGGAGLALNQTGFFHFVQHEHQPAGKHAQQLRQLLLADSGINENDPKNAGVCGREFERTEAFGEFGRGMSADLGKQEGQSFFLRPG